MILQLNIHRSLIIYFIQIPLTKINKQSHYKEEQKRKVDIVLNERQREIEKEMIFNAKRKSFKNFSGSRSRCLKLSY